MITKFVLFFATTLVSFKELSGHGMILDPVNRGSAGKAGFNVTINYDDTATYCGGFDVVYLKNNGKCGVCGDDYSLARPRPNENGGTYGARVIVKRYKSGQTFTTQVRVTANHLGKFSFSICPLKYDNELETEECFDQHPVKLANGSGVYVLEKGVIGDIFIDLKLPANLVCKHCVFRWHWTAANSVNWCKNGTEAPGCGDQELFRTCSNIAIDPTESNDFNSLTGDGSIDKILIIPQSVENEKVNTSQNNQTEDSQKSEMINNLEKVKPSEGEKLINPLKTESETSKKVGNDADQHSLTKFDETSKNFAMFLNRRIESQKLNHLNEPLLSTNSQEINETREKLIIPENVNMQRENYIGQQPLTGYGEVGKKFVNPETKNTDGQNQPALNGYSQMGEELMIPENIYT